MEIRQLKYFIAVAETGSFSEASRRCYLSQSAISQQVKALEEELGCQLFVRNSHKVLLSESGDELLPLAREAVKSFDACGEHICNLNGMLCGQLNIGVSYFAEPYVRKAAVMMLKNYPKVRINFYYLTTTELHRMLVAHELDLAFSINVSYSGEGIHSEPVIHYNLRAILRDTHPLAEKDMVCFDDLVKYNVVMPEAGTRIQASVRKYLDVDLEKLNVRVVVNDHNAMLNLIRETNFVGFLSDKSIEGHLHLLAKKIRGLEMPVDCYVHWLKDSCQKRSAQVFLKYIKEYSVPYCESMSV